MQVWNLIFAILWFALGLLFYFTAFVDNQTIALLVCILISVQYGLKARDNDGH